MGHGRANGGIPPFGHVTCIPGSQRPDPPDQHLPGERYRRIAKRRGKLKALVAAGTILGYHLAPARRPTACPRRLRAEHPSLYHADVNGRPGCTSKPYLVRCLRGDGGGIAGVAVFRLQIIDSVWCIWSGL
jgi:hypothetical protein